MKEQFIEKFNNIHKNKYTYDITNEINTHSNIKIICPQHGGFKQRVHNHLKGAGCRKCSLIKRGESKRIKKHEFIKKSKEIHNDKYDYSLVDFKYNNDKVRIICPVHGEYKQYVTLHMGKSKRGCPKCTYDIISKNKSLTPNEFKNKLDEVIIENYKYDLSNYKNMNSHIQITCKTHNITYNQLAQSFIKGHLGCPKCVMFSSGELKIKSYLEKNKIQYIPQYKFENCKLKRTLSFDFFIPDVNLCVEFDGAQHYIQLTRNGSNLDLQRERDKKKNEFCENNNINLLRIPYWESKNIEKLLKEKFYELGLG